MNYYSPYNKYLSLAFSIFRKASLLFFVGVDVRMKNEFQGGRAHERILTFVHREDSNFRT